MLGDLVATAGDVGLPSRDLQGGLGFDQVQDHPVDQFDLEPGRFSDAVEDFLPRGPPSAGGDAARGRLAFRHPAPSCLVC